MSLNECLDVKEDLKEIYADVSEWLKFAEAKHATTLAIWTALIVALFSIDFKINTDARNVAVVFVLFIFGMLLNILSFVPFLNQKNIIGIFFNHAITKRIEATENLIFYQNIFLISGPIELGNDKRNERYKEKILEKYGIIKPDPIIDSYIDQIVSVATLATMKVYLFDIVAKYILTLIIIFVICIIVA